MVKFDEIKGFAFDLDGVIADTAKFHGQAWHKIADQVGTQWTPELAESLKGISRMDSLELILKAGGVAAKYTPEEKERLAAQKNANYLELIKQLTPADILPGMAAFLDELQAAGYKLVLASASKNAPVILRQLGLADVFADVVDPTTLKAGKPAPDIYLAAAAKMNLAPANVAGVEDASAGVAAIKAAGELAIGIGALPQADVQFKDTSAVSLARLRARLQ